MKIDLTEWRQLTGLEEIRFDPERKRRMSQWDTSYRAAADREDARAGRDPVDRMRPWFELVMREASSVKEVPRGAKVHVPLQKLDRILDAARRARLEVEEIDTNLFDRDFRVRVREPGSLTATSVMVSVKDGKMVVAFLGKNLWERLSRR
jgi:hypothetical protein